MTQTTLPTCSSLQTQETFRLELPLIFGCKAYEEQQEQLLRIDRILKKSGLEECFVRLSLEQYDVKAAAAGEQVEEWQRSKHAQQSSRALRCTILRNLLGESLRGMSRRLAECRLFQLFCKLDDFEKANIPSRSTLHNYEHWLPQEQIILILGKLTESLQDEKKAQEMGLIHAITMELITVDTTCLEANIHFPVDWVLLRDIVRTLMKATAAIRRHGIINRMLDPMHFLSQMNKMCIAMSGARRKPDSKRQRKAILREMKRIVEVVKRHALRHRDLLDQEWYQTDLSRLQAEVILRRIDSVLEQIPAAKRQAHERLIGGRKVSSSGKILSLYDADLHVITRGKAGAAVEFGNTLFIAQQELGYIMDHELLEGSSPGDAQILLKRYESLERAAKNMKTLSGDRGFDSQATRKLLTEKKVYNVLCPRAPKELARRLQEEEKFQKLLKQRSRIEARISILKNVFLQGTPKAKGYKNRSLQVTWAVLSHNLWVIARRASWKEDELVPLAA
jgi:hypothetical protein